MLEPSWIGRRVSVRRVVRHDPHHAADVVGELLGLDGGTAVIETRRGPVEVDVDTVTHARLVPPSTADELALEDIAARGLRPAEVEPLGGWLLRADHGFTHRANSVLPLKQLDRPLDEALAQAREWYAARGLPLQLQLPVEARRLLDAQLGELGWDFDLPTRLLVRRLPDTAPDDTVEIAAAPDEGWLTLYRGGQGTSDTGRALLARHDTVAFATLRRDGRTVAVGRGAVDDGWLGVMAVEVDPAYRRAGLARRLMTGLAAWGRAHGAARSYLQVEAANAPAIALYQSLGYWPHHDYHYRVEPTP